MPGYFYDPDYGARFMDQLEEVYDHHGNCILTECCGVYGMWDPYHENYICPKCGRTVSRSSFLKNYVPAYGPECFSCRTNFPQCVICHKNHQKELDDRE